MRTEDQGDYGWFQYGGRELDRPRRHHDVDLPLPRRADDPVLVLWQRDDDTWVVDDAGRDGYWFLDGFTRDQVIAAVRFAWAMDWLPPETTRPALVRRLGTDDELSIS